MSTVRSEPSIPERSNLAFSPQSVQYMNLTEEVEWLVILAAPTVCEYLQGVEHAVAFLQYAITSPH